jgi:signal transduction histidine kinase
VIVGNQHPGRHRHPLERLSALLILLVLALGLTLPFAPASAADSKILPLTGPADEQSLGEYFEYITDPDWQMSVADFVDPAALDLRPLPGAVPDFGYTAARIWLRLGLRNDTADADAWRFLVHANFTQQIAVYRIADDGAVATLLDLTEDSPFSARPIADPQMVAPFRLAPGEAATLVVAYYSQGSSRISMTVETPESLGAIGSLGQAKNFAFYGMILVMVALALLALAVLRQPVFAAYAVYLLSVFAYIAHADGTAFQYFWPMLPRFNSMASIVLGSAVMVFGALFAIAFLQTARYHPIMHRVLLGLIASVLALDVILWALDPQLLKRLLVLMISVSVLTFVVAGLVAARTRFREVRFYLFGWTAGFIPAVLFTARFAFGIEPDFITSFDAIRLALVVDAMMMGLAIFDRYNHLRQSAMEETLAQAQRNLALSQRLSSLEESYEAVSTSARQREESVKDTVHDLRQPMHALRLSLRQMFNARLPGEAAADAGQVESALSYMESLVADRLAAANTATAAPAIAAANAEPGLHAVLRGVADMFAPEAAARGLGLKLVLAAPDGPVAAYPLMRVLANIVSNAIKYTPAGRVLIGLHRHGAGWRIEVHDTGPGLSGTAFEAALLRNNRLERDRHAAEGSGLGLSVASEVAAANGWKITASEARRTGATIRIEVVEPGATQGNTTPVAPPFRPVGHLPPQAGEGTDVGRKMD